MSAKSDLLERIKRRLGSPSVKIEVEDETIYQHIDYARNKWIKYAVGHATQEVNFTIMLSASQYLYDMPDGTVEVVNYTMTPTEMGGINQLFTVEHMMYEQGMFALLQPSIGGEYNLISYQISRDFLESLSKYIVDAYNFKYHKTTNQLEIQPPPASGNYITIDDYSYDSPGFILVKAFMLRTATLPEYTDDYLNADIYENSQWVEMYSYALTMKTLGFVRRKFSGFGGLGSQNTTLDGGDMSSEADNLIEKLDADLIDKETYIGGYLTMG